MIKKLLIIEDEVPLSNILDKIFKQEGYLTDRAYNGVEGLAKTESFLPNIILLDILLPKMDGIEFLKHLREKEFGKKIPVILLTNLDDKKYTEEASQYGVSVYFVKANTSLEVLKKWVEEILNA